MFTNEQPPNTRRRITQKCYIYFIYNVIQNYLDYITLKSKSIRNEYTLFGVANWTTLEGYIDTEICCLIRIIIVGHV